jgi:hypothetical protein
MDCRPYALKVTMELRRFCVVYVQTIELKVVVQVWKII